MPGDGILVYADRGKKYRDQGSGLDSAETGQHLLGLLAERRRDVRTLKAAQGGERRLSISCRILQHPADVGTLDPALEQIEAHRVKDLAYTFRLPAGTRTLTLRIMRDEEAGEIPLHLK